jgi:DNA-binding NarL/FixJ family response regulator
MTKVAISDAHGVRREGLRALLRSTGEFEIVGEAVDGASTLVLARTTEAALLTHGLSMPGLHGLDLISLIKIENPSLRRWCTDRSMKGLGNKVTAHPF